MYQFTVVLTYEDDLRHLILDLLITASIEGLIVFLLVLFISFYVNQNITAPSGAIKGAVLLHV